jgi:hypothetical protein
MLSSTSLNFDFDLEDYYDERVSGVSIFTLVLFLKGGS